MFLNKRIHSWLLGLIFLTLWIIPAVGLKFLFDELIGSVLLHVFYVMIFLPAWTFAAAFVYTKRCGLNGWLIAYMAAAVATLYLFCGFRDMSPNFCIVNLIGGFFGFGLGNVFKDEALVAAQQDIDNTRRKKKLEQEKKYISLIDTDPSTGERANLRKRNGKKNEH